MDLASKHLGFVLASYGISALVIAGLAAWILLRDRALKRKLAERGGRDAP